MKKPTGRSWVIFIWTLNTIIAVSAGIGLVTFWERTSFQAGSSIPTRLVLATLLPTYSSTVVTAQNFPANTQIQETGINFPAGTPPFTETLTFKPSITPYVHITDTPTLRPWMEGPFTIGSSVQGRPLEMYRFGDGPTLRLIVAGIHGGNEWNTIALADQLIDHLSDHPHDVPEGITLFILRSLNPDGDAREHGPGGRVNEHGVDLNRNFPANWQLEWDLDGCWTLLPVTGGKYAGSEPETVALMLFIQQRKIDALISYHSAALGIFAGGIPPDKASESLAQTLADVSSYPYPPIETGCRYTGNLADWASAKGIAAVDIELTNHKDTDFIMSLEILRTFLNWKR